MAVKIASLVLSAMLFVTQTLGVAAHCGPYGEGDYSVHADASIDAHSHHGHDHADAAISAHDHDADSPGSGTSPTGPSTECTPTCVGVISAGPFGRSEHMTRTTVSPLSNTLGTSAILSQPTPPPDATI